MTGLNLCFSLSGLAQSVVCCDRNEGVVMAIECGDTVELRARKLHWRDCFAADQVREFDDGFGGVVCSHNFLMSLAGA